MVVAPVSSAARLCGSAVTSLTLQPGGRSVDSRASTSGPCSTANAPRAEAIRGSGGVARAAGGEAARASTVVCGLRGRPFGGLCGAEPPGRNPQPEGDLRRGRLDDVHRDRVAGRVVAGHLQGESSGGQPGRYPVVAVLVQLDAVVARGREVEAHAGERAGDVGGAARDLE